MTMRFLIALSLVGVLCACGDPPPSEYPTQNAAAQKTTLGPGDKIEVRIFYGSKEIVRKYTIGGHGSINLPYIGEVAVQDRTQEEIEIEVQARLADGYLTNPIVSLDIQEYNSKKVAILGEVKEPGPQAYFSGMTIVDAIAGAGDFTPMARKNAVSVTRLIDGKKKKFTIPVGSIIERKTKNFEMLPGDTVQVPQRLF